MSTRSCSDARTVFFEPEAELLDRTAQRRKTGGCLQRVLQFGQGAIRLLADQCGERGELVVQDRRAPPRLFARGDLAGLTPALLQPIDPRTTDGLLLREFVRRQAGIRIAQHAAT